MVGEGVLVLGQHRHHGLDQSQLSTCATWPITAHLAPAHSRARVQPVRLHARLSYVAHDATCHRIFIHLLLDFYTLLDLCSRVIYFYTRVTRSAAACHVSPSLTRVMDLSDFSRDPHLTAARSCKAEIIIINYLAAAAFPPDTEMLHARWSAGTRVPRLYKVVSSHAHGGGGGVACCSKWSAGSRYSRATPAHTPGSSQLTIA